MKTSNLSNLLPVLYGVFVDAIGWGIVFPIFSQLLLKTHPITQHFFTTSKQQNIIFELLIATYCIGMFFGSPILGALSDKFGRKSTLATSLLGAAAGFLICSIAIPLHRLSLLFIGRLIAGFTAGTIGIAQAIISDVSDENTFPKHIGWLLLANGIGFSLGPALGSILNQYHPLLVTALVLLSATLYLMLAFRDTNKKANSEPLRLLAGFTHIIISFRQKTINTLLTSLLFFMLAYTCFFSNLPLELKAVYNLSSQHIGFVLTYFAGAFTLSLLFILPYLSKIFTYRMLILLGLTCQAITYTVFSTTPSFFTGLILLALIAMTIPAIYASIVGILSSLSHTNDQGMIMGVVGSVIAAAWGLGPIIASAFQGLHSYRVSIFCITAIVITLALTLINKYDNKN